MADPTAAIDPATLHHAAGSPYMGAGMGMHHHAAPVDLFALVESYRTGILVLDAVLVLLVPILVQQLIMLLQTDGDKSNTLLPTIWKWLRGQDTWVIRTIEVTERFTRDGYRSWDYEQTNHLLQKAISLYLADVLTFEKESAKFELFTKPVDPEELENEPEEEDATMDEDEDEEYDYSGESEIATLAVKTLPLKDRWIEVEKGVEFMHQEETSTSGSDGRTGKETKITFKFASKQKDGSARIEALIAKAFAQYQEMERAKVKDDTARYFYIQSGTKAASGDDAKTVVAYKRYALGEEKTFENLFFDQKHTVLQLLDSFANKTGKFGIKGFPYKLGFLLHGPPGTGKTSLIKAIAHHTKRHIVTINLGKIKSNQELMDAIFDLKFAVDGLDSPVEYSFKDVIFVMEDIDCASSIVNKRTDDAKEKKKSDKLVPTLSARSADKVLMKIAETKSLSDTGGDKEGTAESTESSDAAPATEEKKLMKMMLKMVMDDEKKSSELNLAGLLNVLDGVIDCPGRIIVMTTNHPEKLDPALIRPGRINKKLLLSYMNAEQVRQMIEYYTQQSLDEALMARLEKVFAVDEKLVSPAEVEEMCAEFDATDKIVEALEKVAFASRF